MSMTLEKKIAIASVALCLLTPLALLLYFEFTNSYEIKTSLRIQLFFRNLVVWFWSPMIASFILYTRLRSAAVTASALLAFALHALLAYLLAKDGGLGGEFIWLLYSVWGAACFVLSSLIVLFKPAIFIRSITSAFFSTLIINLLAVPLAIMIFKTM
ncbi:hypothetical protein [Haemophilus parainfluenzae]|uniref:hypothetical protein n=1 Tax=Haemophilus parainfluenzae TaxID=729 RepID=UPI0018A35999|nr:hypothetical protein [Haemophilus parainfluenzae]QOR07239.1 hypothetical protein INP99_05245 [Haemophilus parainfluenzae]